MELIKWAFILGGPAYVFYSMWKEDQRAAYYEEKRRLAKQNQE